MKMQVLAYRCYQIVVLLPFVAVLTAVVFGSVSLLCLFFDKDKVMHPLSRIWGKGIIRASLLPVKVSGLEALEHDRQYIYVANHSSYYDVFLLSGFLPFPRRWMMKRELERVPFFGSGCRHAGSVYVDKGSMSDIKATYQRALSVLREGVSIIIFPEGRRSDDGRMGKFSRTPFTLASEMHLPVVPITINGTFDVLPRNRRFLTWHPIRLSVHAPISLLQNGDEAVRRLLRQSFDDIHTELDAKYQ